MVVVVVVEVIGPGMVGGETCRRPKHLLLLLLFPCTKSGCLLLN